MSGQRGIKTKEDRNKHMVFRDFQVTSEEVLFLLKLFVYHRGGLRVYPDVYVEGVGFICRGWLQSLQQHAGVVPQIRTFPLPANCLPIHYLLTSVLFPGRAREFLSFWKLPYRPFAPLTLLHSGCPEFPPPQ